MTINQKKTPGAAGAATYSPMVLVIYDLWVLGFCNAFAWCCSTNHIQTPFYQKHLSRRHLDIGPGTGYFLSKCDISQDTEITLLDLNPTVLQTAKRRLRREDVRTVQADVMQPLPLGLGVKGGYDSISMFYLLHCLPGPIGRKLFLLKNVKELLGENGVVYGTTVLGKGVQHNWFGRYWMQYLNWRGVFDNYGDGEREIRDILEKEYTHVEVRVVGKVLMFEARGKK